MCHPTTKEIKLGEIDHASSIGILREECDGGFRNGLAWCHWRAAEVAQVMRMSKKTILGFFQS